MSGQDRYIPGVPCWVDTTQPDPEAAVEFYCGLFGGSSRTSCRRGARQYFVARIRGGDVAAVGSPPEGAPAAAAWNTYVWVHDADETAAKVRAAGGTVLVEPLDIGDSGAWRSSPTRPGAAFRVWQAEGASRRRGRQRARARSTSTT